MSGHKFKPLIIGKAARPRAFSMLQNGEADLPVYYNHSKNAWMTSEIFRSWFLNCFLLETSPMLDKGRPDLTLQWHLRYIRYIAAEGGNVVPESMKQKSKTIFPNDIVAKSRAGTNTLQRLNATSTFTLHLTPDQDNTSQNAFVIIIIPYEPEDEDSTGSERVITSEDSSS